MLVRFRKVIVLIPALTLLIACGGNSGDLLSQTSGNTDPNLIAKADDQGRIAYVSDDFQIWTVKPDGSNRLQITQGDSKYTWPGWSPAADMLSYSSFSRGADEKRDSLHVARAEGTSQVQLFENSVEDKPVFRISSPHYALWSPDGEHLAFVVRDDEMKTLYLADSSGLMNPQELTEGKSVSIDWSHDSESLLVRRESDLLRAEINESSALVSVGLVSPKHRMSSWSPTSKMIGMIEPGVGGDALTVSSATGYLKRQLTAVSGNAAFMWSPQGDRIAVGESLDNEDYLLKRLKLVDVASGKSRILKETSIIAFFWAPDGSKIAYVAVGDSGENLQWRILDLDNGTDTQIARFEPSHDQLIWYAFFDQFGESHQVWSPDSTRIIFAGSLDQESTQQGSRIYIADLNDVGSLRVVGRGHLATWSS